MIFPSLQSKWLLAPWCGKLEVYHPERQRNRNAEMFAPLCSTAKYPNAISCSNILLTD